MARIIWKGAISFSLIHIPVSLHPASRANELDLDLLDRRDFSPVGYQRINKSTGKVVEWDDIVKGYQYKKGEYVALTEEDFRRANVAATQTIAIQAFVKQHEIPPQYFETPYYLAPDKRGQKVYALLREAMRESGRWAIGSVVVRTRAYACALIPQDETRAQYAALRG
jgi:DNA end-binding protein Ku